MKDEPAHYGTARTTVVGPGTTPSHDLRGVLGILPFRRLLVAMSLSSLGDWLGLLAMTALAAVLADNNYAKQSFAISVVFILRLAPGVLIGPIAGVVADRLDRRWTMVLADVVRFGLFVSIPIVNELWWLFVASFLVESASLFWIPAKEATVPNLVPRQRLEAANQLSLLVAYGTAPVAAAVFSLLALLTGVLAAGNDFFETNPVDLAFYINAATFLFSAATIYRLRTIPRRAPRAEGQPGVWRVLADGWAFVGRTRMVRGLVIGILGAGAAGGTVIGLARVYVEDLGAGDPGYGVLFGTVFLGLAFGMFIGPRALAGFSRRRLFGVAITGAGIALAFLALVPNLVIVVVITFFLGAFTGVAWVTGITLLGLEVSDDLRGRTFAFVQSMVRVTLVAVLAVAPAISGTIGRHTFRITEDVAITYNGAAITLLIAGLAAVAVGIVSFRQMDDRREVPLWQEIFAVAKGEAVVVPGREVNTGFFVAVEGGEGAGKTTQVELLADWLRDKGHEVVVTREPGATDVGRRLREILLDPAHDGMPSRTETLLYAADRADHVESVIRPALRRGAVVVSDRYVDSTVAYQGAGRGLGPDDLARISRWATGGLQPDYTILLDVPPRVGRARSEQPPDRLEGESYEFHERVRASFLQTAARNPGRYLVVDATAAPEKVFETVREQLDFRLPMSEREREQAAEAARQEAEEAHRAELERIRQDNERRRAEAAARRRAEEEARREAEQERRRQAEEERRRREEEARHRADEARRAEEEARRRLREARRWAEQERRAEEDERRRAEEERRHAEERARHEAAHPVTRELTLADEIFGPPPGRADPEDETQQLPRIDP